MAPGTSRSAERIAFHLLKQRPEEALKLSDAIRDVKTRIKNCSTCYNLTEQDPCAICADASRQLAQCESSDWFWWFGDYNPPDAVAESVANPGAEPGAESVAGTVAAARGGR